MILLLLGVLIFAGVHFIPSLAPGLKAAWVGRLGENGYKGTFSLLLLLGLALIVVGWRSTQPYFLYHLPSGMNHLAMLLLVLAFLLFVISNRPSRLRALIRHPQLTGVVLWGIAHLMLNGDNRSIVLFGAMTIWAIGEVIAINRREGAWVKGDTPSWGTEAVSVVITLIVVAVVAWAHPWFTGMPVM